MPPTTNPNPLAPDSGKKTGHVDLGDIGTISIPTQAGTDYELEFKALPSPSNPRTLNPVLTIDPAPANPLTPTGGPFEGTGAPHELIVEEAKGAPFDYEIEVKTKIDPYLVLYEHAYFNGQSLTIRLTDGGEVNIRKSSRLHDSASSCELFAPANVEVELCEHAVGYHKQGRKARWRGNGGCLKIEYPELKSRKLFDKVSSVRWFVDGKMPNTPLKTVG